MPGSRNLEFGNFHCRFGDSKKLIDLADEIVIPAFQNRKNVRSYGKTKHLFIDTEILFLEPGDPPTIGIGGRYVKDTTLEREQILDLTTGKLKSDHRSMESSPSSLFVLILNTHRLIFYKETKQAPGMPSFAMTAEKIINLQRKTYLGKLYKNKKQLKELGVKRKHELALLFPPAKIEIVPLGSEESFSKFLGEFKKITSVEVRMVNTNDEIDPEALFEQLERQKDLLGSKRSRLIHSNAQGLEMSEAEAQFAPIAQRGNTEVKISGTDLKGDALKGNNEEFRLRIPIVKISQDVKAAAKVMFGKYQEVVDSGLIAVPEVAAKVKNILKLIANTYK